MVALLLWSALSACTAEQEDKPGPAPGPCPWTPDFASEFTAAIGERTRLAIPLVERRGRETTIMLTAPPSEVFAPLEEAVVTLDAYEQRAIVLNAHSERAGLFRQPPQ